MIGESYNYCVCVRIRIIQWELYWFNKMEVIDCPKISMTAPLMDCL